MTATVEVLTEKIEKLRQMINEIEERGEDPHNIKVELDRMLRDLNTKKVVLSENRRIMND